MRRDARRLDEMLEGLSEPQAELLCLGLLGLVALRARHRGLDDALLGSALVALRKTTQTRMKGVVYEHPPDDARAVLLVREIADLFEAEDPAGRKALPADRDLLAVLEGLERGLAASKDDSPHSFLDTALRVVGLRAGEAGEADRSRLIS
jgi:hypothetical protein